MAAIAVVLDHTTAAALFDPKNPFNEAVAAFYVQASGGLGDLYAPVLSLTAGDAERPRLLGYIEGQRSRTGRSATARPPPRPHQQVPPGRPVP